MAERLPSAFQIGERVRCHGATGIVAAVTFTDFGKVQYDIRTRSGIQARINSEHVLPWLPSYLNLVENRQ